MENHLFILIDSLDLKIQLLKDIQAYNKEQEEVFLSNEVNMDDFDEAIEEKGKLIDRLNQLDDGFESLYEKLSEQLKSDKMKYADQIKVIQKKITLLTEMSVAITAQEKRNKALVEQFFLKQKQEISNRKRNSMATFEYYQKTKSTTYVESQFYDIKN